MKRNATRKQQTRKRKSRDVQNLQVEVRRIDTLIPYARNARTAVSD